MKKTIYHRNLIDNDLLDSICTNDDLLEAALENIAKRLKEERLRQNMSVSNLSKLSHVSESTIYRYERGVNSIELQILIKVVPALKLDIAKVISINASTKEETETAGETFSYIVRGQSKKNIKFLLEIIKNMIYFCRLENVNIKK